MRRLHGSIQKLDRDRWRVFATVHDETGASRRVSKTVSGSRNDEERVLDSMLGMEGARRDRPFKEVVEAYLDHARARVDDGRMARSTLEGYEGKLRRTVVPALGSVVASEVTAQRVQRFLDSLRTDRAATFRVLRVVLNWAYRAGYMPERVSDHVEPVRQRTGTVRREDVYDRDEVAAILAHPMETPLKTAVVLALSCGLRRGEICALEWSELRRALHRGQAGVGQGNAQDARLRRVAHGSQVGAGLPRRPALRGVDGRDAAGTCDRPVAPPVVRLGAPPPPRRARGALHPLQEPAPHVAVDGLRGHRRHKGREQARKALVGLRHRAVLRPRLRCR